jgi:N-methylhydantoinase B
LSEHRIDPITLEVVKNALASTADEMALVIMRSAYSPVVRDTMDYSTALCDRTGKVVAQGLTLAVQLGTFPTVMGYVLEQFGTSAQPGDVYIANDPYGCGGQHLPDLYVIKPVFLGGALGARGDDGPSLRRRRHRARQHRRARDRDLPGGAPIPLEARRRGVGTRCRCA